MCVFVCLCLCAFTHKSPLSAPCETGAYMMWFHSVFLFILQVKVHDSVIKTQEYRQPHHVKQTV